MGQRKLLTFIVRENTNVQVFHMVNPPNTSDTDAGPLTPNSCSTSESAQTELMELDETDADSLDVTNTTVNNSKTVDIKRWIEKHSEQHKDLAKILQSNKFTNKHRKDLVKIVVSEMCSEWGNAYPSKEYKSSVARAIVSTFPRLSSKIEGRSHENFYDEAVGEGYLEWRLKTIRKHLPSNEKRKAPTTSTEAPSKKRKILRKEPFINRPLLTESVLIEKISEMKYTKPTDSVKAQVKRLLYETRPNRHTEIKSSESITVSDVLKKYPRLKNYEGEMIDNEFRDIFEGHDVLLARFPTHFAPRIIAHCKNVAPHLLEELTDFDINLKAIAILPELLPPPNHSNVRKAQANEDINAKAVERGSLQKQPFLLCCTNMDQRKGPFFIQVETHLFPVGNNPLRAFDRLFKLHYMFDIHYAASLLNFYNFFESIVYNGLNTPKSCCDSLNSILSVVEIQPESAETDSDSELESTD
ncbi:unnamed protein product [Lasius platythorax]|uniref:Uncharacterized protein n=1 Tax=Lasius platythorax TaxID=488582 RepID=A0AAV2PAP9_9HYME